MDNPIKDECVATLGRHPMLDDLREKVTLVVSIFDCLPKDYQMDGLVILQEIINHAVNKMTSGRVASVRFVPCDSSCDGIAYIWQGVTDSPHHHSNDDGSHVPSLDIKQEPTESAWTILDVCGREDMKPVDEKLDDTYTGSPLGTRRNRGSRQKVNKSNSSSLSILVRSSRLRPTSSKTSTTLGKTLTMSSKTSTTLSKTSSMSSKTSTALICSTINGEKKSLKGKGRKRKLCTAGEVGKPKVKRKKQVTKSSKMLENGGKVGLTVRTGKAKNLSPKTLLAVKADESAAVEEGQLNSAKDVVEDMVKKEPDEGDEETVLSKIPLKMRVKVAEKRWKSSEVKKFRCTDCPYSTNKRIHLEYHMTIHTGTGKFMCQDCDKCFTAASSLRRHQRAHQGIRPFECPICGKGFIDLASLRTHSVVHTGERIFKCEECDKVYTNSANLSRHRRVHTGAMPYICKTCGVKYRDLSSLKLHMLKHTGEKPYLCEVCNKQFKTSSDFRRHERTHTGERKYRCKQCGKTFVQGWNLKQHERIHGDVRPWRCDLCPKAFRSKYSLDHHLRGHTGVKQYQCNICFKWFTTKKYLSNHQVLHTFAKPFRCATCGQKFNQFSNLKRHERIHSDERRYKCSVCDKTFKYINSLQYHEGIHTGVRLTCNKCGVSFRCKSSIRRHRCRIELLDDLKSQDDVKRESSNDNASTDDYDFDLSRDGFDAEREQKVEVVSNLDSDRDSSLRAGQETNMDQGVDFPELKVVLSNIGRVRTRAGCRRTGLVGEDCMGLGLETDDSTIGNVISVSICELDGASYPDVVIKEEICGGESDVLAPVSEPRSV